MTPEQFKALIKHPWTIIILGVLSLGLSIDIIHSATFGILGIALIIIGIVVAIKRGDDGEL